MSRTRDLALVSPWRSSTLRLILLLTILLWGFAVLISNAVYERSEAALVERAGEELDEIAGWIAGGLTADAPPGGVFEDVHAIPGAEPLELEEDGSFRRFLARYTAEINEALTRFRQGRDAKSAEFMTARLWLLGEATAFAPHFTGPEAMIQLMEEEVPEQFLDSLYALAEPRVEDWPANPSWMALDEIERAERLLEYREWFEPSHCVARLDDSGDWAAGNFEFRGEEFVVREPYHLVPIYGPSWEAPDDFDAEGFCLLRSVALSSGTLLLGLRFDEGAAVLAELGSARNDGLVLMLLVALAAAGLLSHLTLRRLRRINDTFAAVGAGDLGARVPDTSGSDEYARLGANINASLDRIERLMSGVRAVSDNIAHDLRTPLTRLRNRIELLTLQETPTPEFVEQVTDEADRLLDVFNALLRIAQLEQGSYRRAFANFDLRTTVSDAVELYEPSIAEKRISLVVELPEASMSFLGDRDLWLQALSNALDNAMKYTPEGGTIRVSLQHAPTAWTLVIADSGPGIPAEEREHVLQRFYRLEAHRGTEGSGLGLSLVAAVCGLHQARLELGGEPGLVVTIRWQRAASTH